ncbi:MAG: hypothetical protein KJ936_03795 [Proteobacteria bacterium]|nr:hypothetical protein [Pseudomonadota bacterium]MBU2226781.1 hypothetical protein [Pseudomonadota bacterium]MBU2262401.1 hypothetical protein [Pseudomonadota bacterium]
MTVVGRPDEILPHLSPSPDLSSAKKEGTIIVYGSSLPEAGKLEQVIQQSIVLLGGG